MPTIPQPSQLTVARSRAAELFGAAARSSEPVDNGARLYCLRAAETLSVALSEFGLPEAANHAGSFDSDSSASSMVRSALQELGSLSLEQFAQSDIRAASELGRRALRRMP